MSRRPMADNTCGTADLNRTQEVVGSIPISSTKATNELTRPQGRVFCFTNRDRYRAGAYFANRAVQFCRSVTGPGGEMSTRLLSRNFEPSGVTSYCRAM